jgi:hypothetical protein
MENDDTEIIKKPTLLSSVVKTGNEARSREEAIRTGERDKQTNARYVQQLRCRSQMWMFSIT